jgi:hypothetical protein
MEGKADANTGDLLSVHDANKDTDSAAAAISGRLFKCGI